MSRSSTGMAEHCSRYNDVAVHFNGNGAAVFALDHQGHGRSEGDRVHVENFDR